MNKQKIIQKILEAYEPEHTIVFEHTKMISKNCGNATINIKYVLDLVRMAQAEIKDNILLKFL